MFTAVLVLSIVICKNGGLTNLPNGRRKRSNNSYERNTKKKYNFQETVADSRDELEEFVASDGISRDREERETKMPVFSSSWSERSAEKEDGDKVDKPFKVVIPLEIEPKRREPGAEEYDNPRSPPLKVVIPIEVEAKKTELGGVKYDKPRSPPLKVVIPIEIEPKKTEMIKDNKKDEETYLDMSLYTNQTTVVNYASASLPTPPPSSEQKQQHEGQKYKSTSLEHIYQQIM